MDEIIQKFVFALIVIFFLIFLVRLFNRKRGLTTEKDQNNQPQIVAKSPDQAQSAQMLASIKKRLKYLINYCINKYPENERVKLLKDRFNSENIQETSFYDSGTSYTVDKGQELHLCLRNKENKRHHDINLLMYVSIHELAHIMSVSFGHNDEFGNNFKFLLEKAVECQVYQAEDYSQNPTTFCGVHVNNNPLFQ